MSPTANVGISFFPIAWKLIFGTYTADRYLSTHLINYRMSQKFRDERIFWYIHRVSTTGNNFVKRYPSSSNVKNSSLSINRQNHCSLSNLLQTVSFQSSQKPVAGQSLNTMDNSPTHPHACNMLWRYSYAHSHSTSADSDVILRHILLMLLFRTSLTSPFTIRSSDMPL
jgi:hypothetical protein